MRKKATNFGIAFGVVMVIIAAFIGGFYLVESRTFASDRCLIECQKKQPQKVIGTCFLDIS